MSRSLQGKTALVTGAGIGIGRGIAVKLASEGANIIAVDLNLDTAAETRRQVESLGRECMVMRVDVADYEQVRQAVSAGIEGFGGIDILVNNAGISPMGQIVDTDLATFAQVMRVNVHGVFHGCKAVGPHMIERKSGKIINIASWFGKVGRHSYGAYSASKFAVIGLTQALAMEMAAHRINVNAVCPGTIVETAMREETDREAMRLGRQTAKERESQIPLGRVGLPDDIAKVVLFLASEGADYMTGQSLNVTGGLWMH